MRAVKIKMKNIVILFFSLFLTLAVFSQINAANLKPTTVVGLNEADWLYYKANNDLSAYLGKKSSSLPTVRYQKDKHYLEFSMIEVSSNDIVSRLGSASVSLETDVKTPNTPTLFYRNIFDGADANYQITNLPFRVKEEITLKKFPISNNSISKQIQFIFSAETSAKPVKQDDGSIAFFDGKGDYLFQLDKPFMIDAKGNRSEEVSLEIKSLKTKNTSEEMFFANSNLERKSGLSPITYKFTDTKNFVKSLFGKYVDNFHAGFNKKVLDLGGIEPPESWVTIQTPHQARPRTKLLYQNKTQNEKLKNKNHNLKTQNSNQEYQILLKANNQWLNSPDRVYPVIIDPTITHNTDALFDGQKNRIADNDSTSSTQLESSYPEATKDPYTVLLLHFNEANGSAGTTIKDYASTTRVITATANASTTNYVTQLGMGNSAAFDGAGDYLSAPDSDDWDFGSGDFTIETWVNFNSVSADQVIVSQHQTADSNTNTFQLTFFGSTGTGLSFGFHDGASWIVDFNQGNTNGWSASQWYHVALVRAGSGWNIYRNGISVAASTASTTLTNLTTGNLEIGRRNMSSDYRYTNGYLDSFRITKGRALTLEEIKASASRRPYAVYTSSVLDASASVQWDTLNWTEGGVNTGDGETLYSTNSLVAQWDFNETSGTNATSSTSGSCQTCAGTLTNFAYTASQDQATTTTGWTANNKKWGAGALMMESAAAADYVSIADPASNALDPGTGDFTIEGWIKSSTAGQDTIIQNNTTVGACAANAGYILIVNGNRNLAAYASDGTTCYVNNLTANASSTEIADGRWHYFAFVADRDTKAYVYYDGRLATSTAINNTTAANPAATLYMGASGATGDSDFILDSARYYSRALSSSEILSNYNAGNIEIQTRTGATSDPNDGTWEAWKPTTGETQLLSMDSDAANWRSDIMASTTIATSTETTLKMEGAGSLKVKMGMASTTAGTVALWHMEETGTTTGTFLYDETANHNNATTTGTTVVDGIFGKARKFNGTSDYLGVGDTSTFKFLHGAEDTTGFKWSADFWVKMNAFSDYEAFFGTGPLASGVVGMEAYIESTRSLSLYITYGVGGQNIISATAGTYPNDTSGWHHIAFTYDQSLANSNFKAYIDGALSGSGNKSGNTPSTANSDSALHIGSGANAGSSTYFLNGTLDELRILKGRVLSADEIAETYRMGANHHLTRQVSATDMSSANKLAFNVAADRTGTYLEAMLGESDYANYELASSTLALSTTTVLYIKGDEIASSTSIKDSSFSGKAITANGDARTSGNGKIGNSVYFDGTGDYLSLADSNDWNFGTGDFSIDFWLRFNALTNYQIFFGQQTDANNRVHFRYTDDSSTPRLQFQHMTGGSVDIIHETNWTPSANVWYHIALVKSSNNYTTYVNSASIGSTADSSSNGNFTGNFYIGSHEVAFNQVLNGWLDELRIIKGTALTADQIRQAYEYGLRSHQITIDFGATLQSSDLISNSTDYNFSITATTSGLSATTSGLYLGDKIVIKENLGGTEYTAQGTVNAVNTTTGAITVPSWDTGSTFPSGNGYSPNATVFKWQREYFDLGGAATTTRNAITNITLRPTNNGGGRTIYLDDFRYNTNYLTAPSSSAITSSNNRYLQYRAIFSSWDSFVSPYLSAINTLYSSLATMFPPAIGVSGGGFLSF